ncbi:MAG: DUF6062 family protein [Spirochaetota bacterium]
MKYELETIPVWEAYEADASCPLCYLSGRLEKQYVTFYLGDSVMTPEIRVQVNRRGFCPDHWHALLGSGNKLGLALMATTCIETVRDVLSSEKRSLSGRRGPSRKAFESVLKRMQERNGDCLICERLLYTLSNYAYTIARLHADEEAFRSRFAESSGFCLNHLPFGLDIARQTLSGPEFGHFAEGVFSVIDRDLSRIHDELSSFTGQFDYRSTAPVTDTMKAAPPAAVRKLAGEHFPGR